MNRSSLKNKPDRADSGNKMLWHSKKTEQVLEVFSVEASRGLDTSAVADARDRYGANSLTKKRQVSVFTRLFKQFQNPLIIILLVAGGATLLLGEYVDAAVITVALLVNVIVGTIQEERASEAFSKLNSKQNEDATVIRDGRKRVVSATEVVVGDIVELDAGDYVPADLRIVDEKNLKVNEAALTGEWMGVAKQSEPVEGGVTVSERSNMAYKGTLVASGEGRGVVTAVGDNTELGKIAAQLTEDIDNDTPIQRHMRTVARLLSIVSLVIVALIFVLGVIRSQGIVEMLLVSIAVAVSVVPEGLPAAVTVVLAIGMERILDKGGLVKNLRAAETLGSTTTILTDKTGTLTQAKMVVSDLLSSDRFTAGEAKKEEPQLSPLQLHLLEAAVTSSDAFVETGDDGTQVVRGRAIEKALVTRGLEEDFDKAAIDERRRDFLAFSSENRYAASLGEPKAGDSQPPELFVSGAPEFILQHATRVHTDDGDVEMTDKRQEEISQLQREKSKEGKRLIAIAFKQTDSNEIARSTEGKATDEQIGDLVFLGLVCFADPIREDVADSIAEAKAAGVHILMVTGDNPETANYIATQAGVATEGAEPLVGKDLEGMSDDELLTAVKERSVFARVLPEQKLRLAKVLQGKEEVVAMTGDGVNDAPALRAADIGVAVGSGTEVAKEASDLVLLDDSFSIIVAAIEEGRRIIDNLKKILGQLLSASFGEVFLIAGALALALPLPVTPAQILWINIVEGGILTFVFAFEPPAPDLMKRDPREGRVKNLISGPLKWLIGVSGTITGIAAFVIYVVLSGTGMALVELRTLMFVILTIDALFFTLALKNFYQPIYKINFTNNRFLFLSLAFSLLALLAAIFVPPLRELLELSTISGGWWLFLAGVGVFDLLVVETAKYWLFQRESIE